MGASFTGWKTLERIINREDYTLMKHQRIDFYSEVRVNDNIQWPEIRGKLGVVLGISEEDGVIYGYSVNFDDIDESWCVDADDITPTGKMFKHEDFYDGSSLGVTPDGKVTRVDIKGQEPE